MNIKKNPKPFNALFLIFQVYSVIVVVVVVLLFIIKNLRNKNIRVYEYC